MRFHVSALPLAVLLFVLPAYGQDLKRGLAAYKRGDYATAIEEWRPLAENGNPGAQYNLGFNYVQGKGVEMDLVQAYFWFELAARQGRGIASQLRDGIAKQMTPEQIGCAKEKLGAWTAQRKGETTR